MAKDAISLMIGGEAGQGLATVGMVLAKALVRAGYHILVTQSYMSRIRGGHNTFVIRASPKPMFAPREGVDLLVALNQETLDLHHGELNAGALVVADTGLACAEAPCFNVPYHDLADKRYLNTVALGVAARLLGLEIDLVEGALQKFLGKLDAKTAAANRQALEKAFSYAENQQPAFAGLVKPERESNRLTMNGNEAIALGAMAAGLKFLAFYPMTPSTSVALTVIANAEKMGIVAEQAEDEIAAINMALGASYAGAPAMVSTSGGGFALMTEGVSLAGMTETPVVIVIAQRPGPATGLPTRTEQGDLDFVLHAGHGEFPRAVFAPGSVEEGFHLTLKAFAQAEKYQGPVFILTDQFLADSHRAVEPFDISGVRPVKAGSADVQGGWDYQRYALTENGISPRALPGLGPELVLADSDEHDASGHITEDAEVRINMVEKRLRKLQGLVSELTLPEFEGDQGCDLLLVSWGSAKGAVKEASAELNAQGRKVASCHFAQVWPLAPESFLPRFAKARQVVMVESNATGQFARLIRRETGFEIKKEILRYDGLPITPEYILHKLAE